MRAKASRNHPPSQRTGPKDLRYFVRELIRVMPGDIKAVDRETVPRFGCTALGELFARQNQYSAFFFRRIKNSCLPLVMNLTATYERLALALETTTEDMVRTYGERLAKGISPLEIASPFPFLGSRFNTLI